MKRTLFTAALAALFCTTTASAQGVAKKIIPVVTVGIKAGVNMQQTSGTLLDNSYATGIVGGAFVCVSKKKMGIRIEALAKSAQIQFVGAGNPVKTVGVDIPVLFEYAPIKRLKLQVGPQYTMLLSAKSNGTDVKNNLASSDISLAAGVEVNLPLKFIVGARYIKGFVDINNTGIAGTGKWTNSSIQLSVGYRFLN